MKIHGSCHCGAIAFEAEVDPAKVVACHCTDCQAMSGAPFRAVAPVPASAFTVLRGTPKHYVKTTAASGNRRAQGFCGDCGTPLYATSDDAKPAAYGIRLGCVSERAQLPPRTQIWKQSAMPWLHDFDAVPASDRQAQPLPPAR